MAEAVVSVSSDGRRVSVERIETNLPDFDAEVRYRDGELVGLHIMQNYEGGPAITRDVLHAISMDTLRKNTFDAVEQKERFAVAELEGGVSVIAYLPPGDEVLRKAAREGRKRSRSRPAARWTELGLAQFVKRYDDLTKAVHPKPFDVLKKEFGLTSMAARAAVQAARSAELWQPKGRGRRGGELTGKARDLLEEAGLLSEAKKKGKKR